MPRRRPETDFELRARLRAAGIDVPPEPSTEPVEVYIDENGNEVKRYAPASERKDLSLTDKKGGLK